MDRRKFLLGVGSASIGGSALLGAGAFSRIESQRQVSISVAQDPNAYLGLTPLNEEWGETTILGGHTPNGDNYVHLDGKGHLEIDIGENPNDGQGVNSNTKTWFDGLFEICNQGKQDVCVSWSFADDVQIRDNAEITFYYDGDLDPDPTTSGRVDVQEGREVHLPLGGCVIVGLRTETFSVDATEDEPLVSGTIELTADVDCPEDPPVVECPDLTEWTEVGDRDEAGGPVILMGLDSELTPGSSSHGPPEEHAAMVSALLGDVTNGEDGILVLGGNPDSNSNIIEYWRNDVGDNPQVDEDVEFVFDENEMENVDFNDYAMIGIVSSTSEIPSGLTNVQNDILIDRAGDIADFVNAGGGLLGKTQDGLNDPWGYVDPFGDFEQVSASFSSVYVTQDGLDLGLTQDGMDGWCCYHEYFVNFPGFFNVLIKETDENGEAAALGGEQVIVEREVSLEISGLNAIEVGEEACYDVDIENNGDEEIEGEFEFEVVSGSGSVTNSLPDTITLDSDESDDWSDAICVSCDGGGPLEVEVRFVDVNDGFRYVEVTMEIECLEAIPEGC